MIEMMMMRMIVMMMMIMMMRTMLYTIRTPTGYRTAAARIHKHNKLKDDPVLIQGRDAYVATFIPFDSKDLKKGADCEANLVLAGCYDKVVRLVDVMTGTDRPIEGR